MTQRIRSLLWAFAIILLAAVLLAVNLNDTGPIASGADVGERLPDFRIVCVDGSEFSLSSQEGKVVVINLWATWCTPCVKELPGFDRLQRENPERVSVLALHVPPVTTDVRAYLSGFSCTIPFAVDEDGSLSEQLHASEVLPQTVILTPDGVVFYNQSGALRYEELVELVKQALGGPEGP